MDEPVHALGNRRHVSTLGHHEAPVVDESFRILARDLVLGGGRERAVAGDVPRPLALIVLDAVFLGILLDAAAVDVLELHDPGELLLVDAVLVVDGAARVGERNDLRSELKELFHRVLGHVAGAGYRADLSLQAVAPGLEHLLGKVDCTVARCLGPDERAAVAQRLAGQHGGEFVFELLVLAEQIPDLPGAHSDISGRDVCVVPDVAEELAHEGLAEPHDLVVRLALWVEVRAALAPAHGQCGERVLEDLLEAEELQNVKVDARVEAEPSLIGPDGAAELHPESAIDMNVPLVVLPGDPENDDPLGLCDPVQKIGVPVSLVAFENRS